MNSVIIVIGIFWWLMIWNLWNYNETDLEVTTNEVTKRKDEFALTQIHQCEDYSIFGKIVNVKTTKEA